VLETITGTDLNTLNNEIAQTGYGDTSDTWGTAYYLVSGIDYTFGQKERGDQDCVLADVD
jgi:hypothetical protein